MIDFIKRSHEWQSPLSETESSPKITNGLELIGVSKVPQTRFDRSDFMVENDPEKVSL